MPIGRRVRPQRTYDESGNPFSVDCYYGADDTTPDTYYYMLNLQGDVIRLIDYENITVANYAYDAWGNILSITDGDGETIVDGGHIAHLNPIRYRSYFYDTETKLYYCNSRYYDPQMRRWINPEPNADIGMFDTGAGLLAYNIYTYCANNPVMYKDSNGESITLAIAIPVVVVGGIAVGIATMLFINNVTNTSSIEDSNAVFSSIVDTVSTNLSNLFTVNRTIVLWSAYMMDRIRIRVETRIRELNAYMKYLGDTEDHHIVAKGARNAKDAQDVLMKIGIDYEHDEENIVTISKLFHKFLHTNMYYGWVNTIVIEAYNAANGDLNLQKAKVKGVLKTLKKALKDIDDYIVGLRP